MWAHTHAHVIKNMVKNDWTPECQSLLIETCPLHTRAYINMYICISHTNTKLTFVMAQNTNYRCLLLVIFRKQVGVWQVPGGVGTEAWEHTQGRRKLRVSGNVSDQDLVLVPSLSASAQTK